MLASIIVEYGGYGLGPSRLVEHDPPPIVNKMYGSEIFDVFISINLKQVDSSQNRIADRTLS